MTDLFESGKVPEIRKIAALLRLDRLDRTIVAHEKFALTIGLFAQRQPATVRPQPGMVGNEVGLPEAKVGGNPRDLRVGQAHLARPPATRRATLAFVENRHTPISNRLKPRRKEKPALIAGRDCVVMLKAIMERPVQVLPVAALARQVLWLRAQPEGALAPERFVGGVQAGAFVPMTEVLFNLVGRFPSSFPLYQHNATTKMTSKVM